MSLQASFRLDSLQKIRTEKATKPLLGSYWSLRYHSGYVPILLPANLSNNPKQVKTDGNDTTIIKLVSTPPPFAKFDPSLPAHGEIGAIAGLQFTDPFTTTIHWPTRLFKVTEIAQSNNKYMGISLQVTE